VVNKLLIGEIVRRTRIQLLIGIIFYLTLLTSRINSRLLEAISSGSQRVKYQKKRVKYIFSPYKYLVFSPYKVFQQVLVPQIFSIMIFGLYFSVNLCISFKILIFFPMVKFNTLLYEFLLQKLNFF
jgi:hypothetical protein